MLNFPLECWAKFTLLGIPSSRNYSDAAVFFSKSHVSYPKFVCSAAEQNGESSQAVDVCIYDGCTKHHSHNLAPARLGTAEDRDHPFPAETFQDRDLTMSADPYVCTQLH